MGSSVVSGTGSEDSSEYLILGLFPDFLILNLDHVIVFQIVDRCSMIEFDQI